MLNRLARHWIAISCLIALTACGGGGGSGDGNPPSNSGAPTSGGSASPTGGEGLTPFSPESTATPTTTRSVHLSWTPPVTRADGSALPISAIQGYRLYYVRDGSNPSDDVAINIQGGTTTSTSLSLAAPATYIFALTAIGIDSSESGLSEPVSITLP